MRSKEPHGAGVISGRPTAARPALPAASGEDTRPAHSCAGTTADRPQAARNSEEGDRQTSKEDGLLIDEAAARLRCDRSTIYRLIRNGILWGWGVSTNPNSYTGRLRIASESIDNYKRRYFRGGSSALPSTRSSESEGGWVRPARRRAEASGKKYRESLLSLESVGITFKSRKASE